MVRQKEKTIYEGRNMRAGNNMVPVPDKVLACGQSALSTVTVVPLLGFPQPPALDGHARRSVRRSAQVASVAPLRLT